MTFRTVHLLVLAGAMFLASGGGFSGDRLATAADEVRAAGKPVKALMITGGCCHDYQNQKRIISEGLSKSIGNIDWTILHYDDKRDTKAEVYENANWIDGFDIVIHNECFGGVDDPEFLSGIVDAHYKRGVPCIMVHCSLHSYRVAPNADKWRELVGVTSRRHERKNRPLDVVLTEAGKSHAITAKIPAFANNASWKTPNGELYIIEQVWPQTTVLATVKSVETNQDEPVVWTQEKDGVKTFGISLGHHNETMLDETWQQLVAEGWRWALAKD